MEKVKICFVSPLPPPYGGIANWSDTVRRYLENDNQIIGAFINTAPKKRVTEGRTLFDRIIVSGFDMLRKTHQLRKMMRTEELNVVHITTSGQLAIIRDLKLLRLARKYKVRSIYHIHFGRIPDLAVNNTREWKLISKAARLSDCVITIDPLTYRTFREYLPTICQLEMVANPFDLDSVINITETEHRVNAVFIGWVVKTKGIEELLEAWQMVRARYPDADLNIVGPVQPEYENDLSNRYSFEGVTLLGEKSHKETLQILSESEILILPSYTEGFPTVVLEAMALKKAIIATDVGAISSMLSDKSGIVIPVKSVPALAQAVVMLLDDHDAGVQMGRRAYERLCREYAINVVMQKYKDLWCAKNRGNVSDL